MSDYVLVCYPSDPGREGETVDNRINGAANPWDAIYILAQSLHYAPWAFQPTRIDVLTAEEYRAREKGGTAG